MLKNMMTIRTKSSPGPAKVVGENLIVNNNKQKPNK